MANCHTYCWSYQAYMRQQSNPSIFYIFNIEYPHLLLPTSQVPIPVPEPEHQAAVRTADQKSEHSGATPGCPELPTLD